jgi:hypothetical protein
MQLLCSRRRLLPAAHASVQCCLVCTARLLPEHSPPAQRALRWRYASACASASGLCSGPPRRTFFGVTTPPTCCAGMPAARHHAPRGGAWWSAGRISARFCSATSPARSQARKLRMTRGAVARPPSRRQVPSVTLRLRVPGGNLGEGGKGRCEGAAVQSGNTRRAVAAAVAVAGPRGACHGGARKPRARRRCCRGETRAEKGGFVLRKRRRRMRARRPAQRGGGRMSREGAVAGTAVLLRARGVQGSWAQQLQPGAPRGGCPQVPLHTPARRRRPVALALLRRRARARRRI